MKEFLKNFSKLTKNTKNYNLKPINNLSENQQQSNHIT